MTLGRKRQPTALLLLKGNPGKRPLPAREPKPRIVELDPPEWLSDEARAEWLRVAPMLYRLGVLTEADGSALVAYCEAWSRWITAERAVQKTGLLVKTPNGFPVVSPMVGIANKAMQQMRAFLTEFGMTPASRAKVSAQESGEDDPLDEFTHHGR